MKKILSIIFIIGMATSTHAQLLVTDSSFSTSFGGTTLELTGTDSSYHDATNCRVAYRYSKGVIGGQLVNTYFTTYDYYPNGTLRQTVVQSWNAGTSTYGNMSRTTTTYYQSTTKPLSTLSEDWTGSAWQNASLDSNIYDANGFLIRNINQDWAGTTWSTKDSTIYYNNAAGLADSSIRQEFDANQVPTDRTKQIYTYLTGTSLISQQRHQTLVNNQWQDSSRYTSYYGVNNRIDSLHGEFYDPETSTFILALRSVNQYNAANQVIVATIYITFEGITVSVIQTRFNYIPCNILPVTLLDFKANKQKNEVLLRWSTSSESNSAYFDIQRSTDNVNFVSVGRENAAGNSNTRLNYQFTDNVGAVTAPKYIFYRLRQADKDEKSSYSPIVFVTVTSSGLISFAPNPARDRVSILHDNSVDLSKSIVTITDISGKTLLRQKFRDESIPLASFGKGVYIIKLTNASGTTITRKLIVQ